MNKEKILKHLRKAEEEINNELNIAVESNTVITNIDLEYIYHQISDIITEIENADDIEEDIEEEDPWAGLEDDDALFDDY
jgi:CRISPR/Cas system CSM-associated protein Csm2 small subunit